MPKYPTSCAYCGGPMPPPALTGRPRSFCSAQCRQASEWAAGLQRQAEMERSEREEWSRRHEEARAERARRAEEEYQQAIKAGGDTAAWARWERAYTESLDNDGPGLCQWQDTVDGRIQPRQCFEPESAPGAVYCAAHCAVVDEHAAAYRTGRSHE